MIEFSKKKIERTKTLGERLKKVREESGISLEEAGEKVQIKKEYLQALEQGTYSDLPGPVYIESFLKKYAEFLHVSSDFVLSLYHDQEKKSLKKQYHTTFSPLPKSLPKDKLNPKMIRNLLISLIILACLIYIGFVIAKIFSPPNLTVSSPIVDMTTTAEFIDVSGQTEPEANLEINGQQIILDEDGNFSESVNLKEGLNKIIISASKEKSKDTIIKRNIIKEKLDNNL